MPKKKSIHRIYSLILKDFLLELRNPYSGYALLLFVISSIFILYMCTGIPENTVWNALFWILQLFVCISAVSKNFTSEDTGLSLYYYVTVHPVEYILAKLFFNTLLMLFLSVVIFIFFLLLLGNPFAYIGRFTLLALLGSMGISLIFTFLSTIAHKVNQQSSFVALLGFPLIIPQLLLLLKLAIPTFDTVVTTQWWYMILILCGYDIMVIILSIILFPFIWGG
ncbi:MAG: heme exporter protein CcmB [Phycisphaerales bacterium]|nr:heme exporter protein CcmB [Phycisphaerales bacterium]